MDEPVKFKITFPNIPKIDDVDVSKITLGAITQIQHGQFLAILYDNKPFKFMFTLNEIREGDKYEFSLGDETIMSNYGLGVYDDGTSEKKSYSLGLSMYGKSGVTPKHQAIINKLDEIHERICKLLTEKPSLFPKRNPARFNIDWVKEKIDPFYTYPKKQTSDGNKTVDITSENRTVYLKVKYYENNKNGSKFINVLNKSEKKRNGRRSVEAECPLNDDGTPKYGRNTKIHAAVACLESFFISTSSIFYKRLVLDTVYLEPGNEENYEFEIINREEDVDEIVA
jgi:hypothetical protein